MNSVRKALVLLWCVTLFSTGCEYNKYAIQLDADGDALHRTLTCSRWDRNQDEAERQVAFPAEEAARIAKLYPNQKVEGETHIFDGKFEASTPQDLGGSGSFGQFPTQLGTAFVYMERFRGQDDLDADMQASLAACDRLADFLSGWLRSELSHEPGWPKLEEFLKGDFRKDIRNMVLYFWMGSVASKYNEKADEEWAARACQYLVQRSYATLPDVAVLAQTFHGPAASTAAFHLLQRQVMWRMQMPQIDQPPHALAFLAGPEAAAKSLREYANGTKEYKELHAKWEAEKAAHPENQDPEPDAIEVPGRMFADAVGLGLSVGPQDQLSVTLICPVGPVSTNGKWDAQTKHVAWPDATIHSQQTVPTFCYALWAVADEKFQTEHFGKTLLAGSDLAEYAIWWHGLDGKDRAEWDAFVAGLKPGEQLAQAVKAFRFTRDKMAEKEEDTAQCGRDLLLKGLEPAKPPAQK